MSNEWESRAACAGDHERFWEDFDQEALNICWNRCPVRIDCLKAALTIEREQPNMYHFATIRGGYTPHERYIMIRHLDDSQWSNL